MNKKEFKHGPWSVIYSPDDGARLDCLRFNNYNLLTGEPKSFRPPAIDYGLYETRPVYGYDDCFPSCDVCKFPDSNWDIPDHGEICWLKWQVTEKENRLLCSVKSEALPVVFKREMIFNKNSVLWKFEVRNNGDVTLPFVHIIHPLMPLDEIIDIKLPEFEIAYDAIHDITLGLKDAESVQKFLYNQKKGTANMLFLQNVQSGKMSWVYKNNLRLEMSFPVELFPTIGIWWNNTGYPDEDGCRRNECAFEPVPGPVSELTEAFKCGTCLSVPSKSGFNWEIAWWIS